MSDEPDKPKSVLQGLRTLAFWASEDGDFKTNYDYAHKVYALHRKALKKARKEAAR